MTRIEKNFGLSFGAVKARIEASALFDPFRYQRIAPGLAESGLTPLDHYLKAGEAQGITPNAWFDPKWYLDDMAPPLPYGMSALLHYIVAGAADGLDPSPSFSSACYAHFYPDVGAAGLEPLQHFLKFGQHEGRIAFPRLGDTEETRRVGAQMLAVHQSGLMLRDWYKSEHFTLYGTETDPLVHYVLYGEDQGWRPNPYFDPEWYRQTYGDRLQGRPPLVHYAIEGWLTGCAPSPEFSTAAYLAANPDLANSGVEPLQHFLTRGRHEGRQATALDGAHIVHGKGEGQPLSGDPLRLMLEWQKTDLAPPETPLNTAAMSLHWIVPDFAPGAGGHMTIFRMMHFLAHKGHRQTLWIHSPKIHTTPGEAFDTIQRHFQQLYVDVRFVDDSLRDVTADAVIATDCFSVWPALAVSGVRRRFYFVQDLEARFHPLGARALAAEATYGEDIDCICASPWLASVMQNDHGRWARPFSLAADPAMYYPPQRKRDNDIPRIAVYARMFTERRLVEFALLGLEILAERGIAFHVDFFGADCPFASAPYRFTDHGVCAPSELGAIFRHADIGVVFSATNYSLVPQEMMACDLPVVECDGPNTRAIFPDGVVQFAKPNPHAVADALEVLLRDPDARRTQAEAARAWVSSFSWQGAADAVEAALAERLTEQATTHHHTPRLKASHKAAIVIPTLNPGPVFADVLARTQAQQTAFDFEVLVIDSGSTDGTVDLVRASGARLIEIDKSDFNHGDTRNLGVAETDADYIAFLTHDAQPASKLWLAMMVEGLEHYPEAAGAFGRHLPWPEASPFTKRDLNAHFDGLAEAGLLINAETNRRRYAMRDPRWMQVLHFYSDNNSIMRRSVWEDLPYRRTAFGEDQLWAMDIIDAGHSKLYLPNASVYHSHNYDTAETEARNHIEAAFFKHFFGYALMESEEQMHDTLEALNRKDDAWARTHHIPDRLLAEQKSLNAARLKGLLSGTQADTDGMF